MARVFTYRLLLVMAFGLGGLLSTSAAFASAGVEIWEREVVRTLPGPQVPPGSQVPTYECGMDVCECYGQDDCNKMFEELDCARDLCDESGNSDYCVCIFPIEKPTGGK